MHAIVSVLPSPFYEKVETLWAQIEQSAGIQKSDIKQYPHLSWQIGADYQYENINASMIELAAYTKPIKVRTSGIGIFTGENPVIYIPIIKTKELILFHNSQWEKIKPVEERKNEIHAPGKWVPHISIAFRDVTHENIGKIMQIVAFDEFNWEFEIDNIALLFCKNCKIGDLVCKYPFLG